MTPAWTPRRRADEFEASLEGRPSEELDSARYAELLELVAAVRSLPRPEPRPDFSASLRERLMAEADTVLVPLDRSVEDRLSLPIRDRSRRDRRLAVAAGAFVLVGATSSMAVASQSALPGETLYPVKRAIEAVRTDITLDDTAKAHALLDRATDRLREATQLAAQDRRAQDSASATLTDFAEQARQGSTILLEQYDETDDSQHITDLREFTATSMSSLQLLEASLPSSAAQALYDAAQTVQQIDAQAVSACPACGGAVVPIPQDLYDAGPEPTDDAGPAAGATPSDQPRPPRASPTVRVPDLDPGVLPPGSLTGPSTAPEPTGAPGAQPSSPTSEAEPPGPLTSFLGGGSGASESPLGGLLSPVTEAVDELTAGLGLDLGPLLGLPPRTPKPSPKEGSPKESSPEDPSQSP